MSLVYSVIITLCVWLIHFASLFSKKAGQWVDGRKGWQFKLKEKFHVAGKVIWIHCASLGEFEQGRPVIEMLKEKMPSHRILVTFFSPSGYEIMKGWPVADHICYLPSDTPRNASRFLEIVRPSFVIFVKYEFWHNYISAIHMRNIPLYLVSGIFRSDQYFFRWYGSFFRKMLKKFETIFVQDDRSRDLLLAIGVKDVVKAGDTRFDRVAQIANISRDIPVIERFRGDERIFLAGSSWPPDEEIITRFINEKPGLMKWIFAPHEIDPSNIRRLEALIKVKTARYSGEEAGHIDARVLIIDNIGLLSSAYRYAYIAAVGGGFGKGIHNILEPACWGIPVLFGPDHKKFREALDLLESGGAFTFRNYEEFSSQIENLLSDENQYRNAAGIARDYINSNKGVTEKIIFRIMNRDINI